MDKQQPACATCGTTVELLRCAKCKTVYYCSTSHQHMDWPNHKQECRQLAKQKNNNRQLQQLQQAVAAATLKGTTTPPTGAGATDCFVNGGGVGALSTVAGADEVPAIISHSEYGDTPMSTMLLGTNENEIMNTQAETVSQRNSNGIGYLGNVDANSTTMEQMFNCNTLQTNDSQHLQESHHHQQQHLSQNQQNLVISMPPQQMQQNQNQHQYLQQQHINQNNYNNQNEKSSSYQIGRVDENGFGNANERRYEDLCRNIINDMNQYGLSVVDDFLGMEKGLQILNEVHRMYAAGVFKDGQLVSNLIAEQDLRTIRGDKITWVKGVEQGCSNVGYLINQIDAVICRANTMKNNGKLGNYNIKERTKAMVACYPGSGSHYVMHVDNPNRDGRVITAIYYLNVNWDTKRSGGVLRIFPEHGGSVADIEPKFDRLIFFWSDKRNPHEVQPAHRTRYAITVWYFDANEREAALNRCRQYKNNTNSNTTTKTTANVNHKTNTHTNTSDICT